MATRRGYYREELRRSISNLEMALTHLARFIEAYAPQHPDKAVQVGQIGEALVQLADLIQKVHDEI